MRHPDGRRPTGTRLAIGVMAIGIAIPTAARETEFLVPAMSPELARLLTPARDEARLAFDFDPVPLAIDTPSLALVRPESALDEPLDLTAIARHDTLAPDGVDGFLEFGVAPTLTDLGLHVRSSVPVHIALPVFAGVGLDPTQPFGGGAAAPSHYVGTGVEVGVPINASLDVNAGVHFQLMEQSDDDPFRVIGRLGVSWRF